MNPKNPSNQATSKKIIQYPNNVYLVGGFVRDKLLGINSGDRDWLVVGSNPKEMKSFGFIQVGKDFPVFINPNNNEEYALARIETKKGEGYLGFSCEIDNVSLIDDLQRRDLTINAMAMQRDKDGNEVIIDPFSGKEDIKNKIIRHCSDAFVEDPLRVIRVARFLAKFHHLGFKVHLDTLNLLKQMVKKGEINHLTSERIWLEVQKLISSQNPEIFFLFLNKIGALDLIFPEYSKELQSDWFKSLNGFFKNTNYSMLVRITLCFFGYPKKNQLTNWFNLSKNQTQLFNLLANHQTLFNQFIDSVNLNEDLKKHISSLIQLFKEAGVLKEKSLIDEFITIQMAMNDIDLTHHSMKKFIAGLYAYLSADIEGFLKNEKAKQTNLSEKIENFRAMKVYDAVSEV